MENILKLVGSFFGIIVTIFGSWFAFYKYRNSEKTKKSAFNNAEKEFTEMIEKGQKKTEATLLEMMAIIKATEAKVDKNAKDTKVLLQMHKYTQFARTLPAIFRNRLNSLTNKFPHNLSQKLSMAFDKVLPILIEILGNDFQYISAESIEKQLTNKAKEMKTLLYSGKIKIDEDKILELQKDLKLIFTDFSLKVAGIPEKFENGERGKVFRDYVLDLITDVVKSTNSNLID